MRKRKNILLHLGVIIALYLIQFVLYENLLDTTEKYRAYLSQNLVESQVNSLIENSLEWRWLSYVLFSILILAKILFVSFSLYAGSFFFQLELSLKKIVLIATKAEYIFVLVGLLKLLWLFFSGDYVYEDIQYFYPLSALNIVGYEGVSLWFIYPLQVLNLFELGYWILLAYLLSRIVNITIDKGLSVVASSYGSGLLIWVVAVMFFTLNMG